MMRWCVLVILAAAYSSSVQGMSPYGAAGRTSGSGGQTGSVSSGSTGSGSASRSSGSFPSGGLPGVSGSAPGSGAFPSGGRATGGQQAAVTGGSSGGRVTGGQQTVGTGVGQQAAGSNFPGFTGPSINVGAGAVGSGGSFPGFGGPAGSGSSGQGSFQSGGSAPTFGSNIVEEQITPTVTQTLTVDAFTTLTDTVFNSYGVTLTQFSLTTATRPVDQTIVTPVNDRVAISTTVVQRPEFITVTETKSDFRLVVRTSVVYVTLFHTSYAITHTPFTITATETVQITSPMVKTIISTRRETVTDYQTIVNTVFVHAGYGPYA